MGRMVAKQCNSAIAPCLTMEGRIFTRHPNKPYIIAPYSLHPEYYPTIPMFQTHQK